MWNFMGSFEIQRENTLTELPISADVLHIIFPYVLCLMHIAIISRKLLSRTCYYQYFKNAHRWLMAWRPPSINPTLQYGTSPVHWRTNASQSTFRIRYRRRTTFAWSYSMSIAWWIVTLSDVWCWSHWIVINTVMQMCISKMWDVKSCIVIYVTYSHYDAELLHIYELCVCSEQYFWRCYVMGVYCPPPHCM